MAFVPVLRQDDVVEGHPQLVTIDGTDVAIFRVGHEVFAIDDLCSHAEASLAEGDQRGYIIECPRHGGRFDIRTGQAKHFPAVSPVRTFKTKVEDGQIFVDLDSSA